MTGALVAWGRPITARHETGHRFTIRIRGHELTVDQPRGSGGEDAGPSSTELFVASLIACVAHYAHLFLARHEIAGELHAEGDWWVDFGSERVTAVEIRLTAPTIPEELEPSFEETVEHCLVHNTLRTAPEVRIEIRHATTTDAAGPP